MKNIHNNKNKLYISTYKKPKPNIMKNDIVFIYVRDKNKIGFVSMCQIKTNMIINETNIHIFNDETMNKYYSKLKTIIYFNTYIKLNVIKKKCNITLNKYISGTYEFNEIPQKIGIDLLTCLIEIHENCNNNVNNNVNNKINNNDSDIDNNDNDKYKDEDDDDNEDDGDNDEDNEDIDDNDDIYDYDNDEDNNIDEYNINEVYQDDTVYNEFNIPILYIQCDELEKLNNETNDKQTKKKFIKNFKSHYVECNNCTRIDNNKRSFDILILDSKIKYEC